MIKRTLLIALFCLACVAVKAQTKPVYDEALATKLGADQYGMKKYVMAFLKTGPTKIESKEERTKIQMAHLKNIMRLADEGKLVVAGPFMDGGDVQGIFIFNVNSIDEARTLTETDPAIKAGILVMELRPFYCSAALMEINNIHKKIEKKSVAE